MYCFPDQEKIYVPAMLGWHGYRIVEQNSFNCLFTYNYYIHTHFVCARHWAANGKQTGQNKNFLAIEFLLKEIFIKILFFYHSSEQDSRFLSYSRSRCYCKYKNQKKKIKPLKTFRITFKIRENFQHQEFELGRCLQI